MRKLLVLVWLSASVAFGGATPTPTFVPYAVNGFGNVPTVFVNLLVPLTPTPTATPTATRTPIPMPQSGKIVRWYKIDEGSGNTIHDSSPTEVHMTGSECTWPAGGITCEYFQQINPMGLGAADFNSGFTVLMVLRGKWTTSLHATVHAPYIFTNSGTKNYSTQVTGEWGLLGGCSGADSIGSGSGNGAGPCVGITRPGTGWEDDTWHLYMVSISPSAANLFLDGSKTSASGSTITLVSNSTAYMVYSLGGVAPVIFGYNLVWSVALEDGEAANARAYVKAEMQTRGITLP